jgi:pyridoxine 5'-phosphate synthase PdxJ
VQRAIKFALENSGLSTKDIVHLNAHATSTPAGDVAEANALRKALGADAVEIHTGKYCNAAQGLFQKRSKAVEAKELLRITAAGNEAKKLGLHAHVGHGFDLLNVRPVAATGIFEEYNIGHSIICRAALFGLSRAVREMLSAIHAP